MSTMYEDRQRQQRTDEGDPKSARARAAVRAYLEAKERAGKVGFTLTEAMKEEKEIEAIEQRAMSTRQPKAERSSKGTERPRQLVFGKYPMTAVLRWMGAQGWTVDRALAVLTKLGITPQRSTAAGNMRAGKAGKEWVPDFTKDEQSQLEAEQ